MAICHGSITDKCLQQECCEAASVSQEVVRGHFVTKLQNRKHANPIVNYNISLRSVKSKTGKKIWFQKLTGANKSFGAAPFVQTVQQPESFNLHELNRERHDVIVLDNVHDQKFVLDSRAALQANNDIHTLAESKTGIYFYCPLSQQLQAPFF